MRPKRTQPFAPLLIASLIAALLTLIPSLALASGSSYLSHFSNISTIASTIPSNGDVNPYGIAVVPTTVGNLYKGNVLVSNFNNSQNLQGTGTTLVQITPNGTASLFAQINPNSLPGACPGGVGLSTALTVLQRGWVVVGSLPTTDGMSDTAKAGCLIVLDSSGNVIETFSGKPINGPWDMTAYDGGSKASLFVTNVLNGTVKGKGQIVNKGAVIRIDLKVPEQGYGMPKVKSITVIGSQFSERTDPAALVIGPTGLGLSGKTLFVADSLNNRVAAIPNALNRYSSAGTGQTVTTGGMLNDPLGLTIAPNGDIITVNGNDGYAVETDQQGYQVDNKLLDSTGNPPGAGCLFGLTIVPGGHGLYFVDDCDNTLKVLN